VKKRTFVSIALALALVLAIAAPAFAQSISYQADLQMDGTIDREMQLGHLCNTGAEMKQTITGTGTLSKATDATMVQGRLTVADRNDFVTAVDAVRNLTVTSVIELCAPPKMTYEGGVVHPIGWYNVDDMPQYLGYDIDEDELAWFGVNNPQFWYPFIGDFEAVSKQIWAVQVEAAAGYSGNLHQQFEAAYGPYEGWGLDQEEIPADPDPASNRWAWAMDEDGVLGVEVGQDFVGNYFSIGQMARTSQGVVRRFIDISSPWSHAYLMEDMTVIGFAEISETFTMGNLPRGEDMVSDWWDLF
jgi:hypothetical protein